VTFDGYWGQREIDWKNDVGRSFLAAGRSRLATA
jgi:hypothetical protein